MISNLCEEVWSECVRPSVCENGWLVNAPSYVCRRVRVFMGERECERERERESSSILCVREGGSWSKCALHSAFKFGGENECTLHSV